MSNFADAFIGALLSHPRFLRLERLRSIEEQARGSGRWYRVSWLLPSGRETSAEGALETVVAGVLDTLRRSDEWAARIEADRAARERDR